MENGYWLPPPPPPPSSDAPPPPPPSDSIPPPPPSDVNGTESGAKKRKLGWGAGTPKAAPLSIEELLAKKKAADDAASKPKFLSKKERERIALEKREKEVAASKHKEQSERANNHVPPPPPPRSHAQPNGHRGPPTGPRGGRNGQVPTGPSSMRSLPNKGYDMAPPPPPKSVAIVDGPKSSKKASEQGVEAEMIKHRYMGADTNTSTFSAKKKRKRTTEKKFNFEWNTEEDTSPDYNPLYQTRAEGTSLFGRGRLGGFADDTNDTMAKAYARAIEERDPEAGRERALEILEMERRRREEGGRNGIDKHWSEKKLEQMRERDWRIFKEDFNIATKGGSIPNPMRTWEEAHLPKRLMDIVDSVGYTEPSAVQRAAIPIALQSRDLIGVAVTGSGKTAAFLLPLLVYISELPKLDEMTKNDGPYAIILAPTRELAQQIELEAKKFATPLGFTCVSLVGGHSIERRRNYYRHPRSSSRLHRASRPRPISVLLRNHGRSRPHDRPRLRRTRQQDPRRPPRQQRETRHR